MWARIGLGCGLALGGVIAVQAAAVADGLPLAEGLLVLDAEVHGRTLRIDRDPAALAVAAGPLAPMAALPGVALLGEVEVLAFLATDAAAGRGMLVDTRLPEAHAAGTIPGALNLPAATLAADNPLRTDILAALGGVADAAGEVRFADPPVLVLFGDGIGADAALAAGQALLQAGYPADRLRHYRGGFRDWRDLGLTVAVQD
jgi:rhodanese-related sulfurtransferase